MLFGLLPAWHAARPEPIDQLRGQGRGLIANRLHGGLLVLEVAISVLLLAGAGLMLRSLVNLQRVDPGYEPGQVLTFQASVDSNTFDSPDKRWTFFRELRDELQALPGVAAAGGIRRLPLYTDEWSTGFARGDEDQQAFQARTATYDWVLPGYFEAMEIDVLAGRALAEQDFTPERTASVVIDEDLAAELWPGGDAVGPPL